MGPMLWEAAGRVARKRSRVLKASHKTFDIEGFKDRYIANHKIPLERLSEFKLYFERGFNSTAARFGGRTKTSN